LHHRTFSPVGRRVKADQTVDALALQRLSPNSEQMVMLAASFIGDKVRDMEPCVRAIFGCVLLRLTMD